MYIPLTFFSTQGSCVTATTTALSGSGTITSGSFVSGGFYWDYYKFETLDYTNTAYPSFTASLNILSGSTGQAKLLVVAGGGTGGGRQVIFTEPGADRDWQTDYTGGGGAGGVVYYNQFPLASGNYEIGVAGAIAGTNGVTGSKGRDSYIKLPNNQIYTPFDSSYLLAEGGGFGGTIGYDRTGGVTTYRSLGPGSGGSAGGAGSALDGTAQGGSGAPNPNGGLNNQVQGYRGGLAAGVAPSTGGGGAGATGEDAAVLRTKTNGGVGVQYNLTGTPTYYAGGGGGATQNSGLGLYGQGGKPATTVGGSSTSANGGVVVIAIPRCSSAFSCKLFGVTGSTGILSYMTCDSGFVTQSILSSPLHTFTACLITFSGSNTPALLEGETTASVIGNCDSPFTSSTNCHCSTIRAVPNSGTQTLTYWPCNGSGSVNVSVPPAGAFFCREDYSAYSFPSGGVTEFGLCSTGSCQGIQYTSSVVNCSSRLATAGSGGGTLTWLPCGSSSVSVIELSGSESRSICAAYTASFGGLTGIGSTIVNLGTCSYTFPPPIVSWSYTEENQNGTFSVFSGASTIATLTANGSGSAAITGSRTISASLAPVGYPTSGSMYMSLIVSGSGSYINLISNQNTTLTASFIAPFDSKWDITGRIGWDNFPAITSSIWSYLDIANPLSYNGSGSTIQDLTSRNNDATIAYPTSWSYASPEYLGVASPSLILKNAYREAGPYMPSDYYRGVQFTNGVTTDSFTLLLSWYGQNSYYTGLGYSAPLIFEPDQDPGNNQFGMKMGHPTVFTSSVVAQAQSTDLALLSGSALPSHWHISQVSWDANTAIISYCLDGTTGSVSGGPGGGTKFFEIFPASLFGDSVGSGSAWQVATIYSGSLTTTQMLQNHNALKARYGL